MSTPTERIRELEKRKRIESWAIKDLTPPEKLSSLIGYEITHIEKISKTGRLQAIWITVKKGKMKYTLVIEGSNLEYQTLIEYVR